MSFTEEGRGGTRSSSTCCRGRCGTGTTHDSTSRCRSSYRRATRGKSPRRVPAGSSTATFRNNHCRTSRCTIHIRCRSCHRVLVHWVISSSPPLFHYHLSFSYTTPHYQSSCYPHTCIPCSSCLPLRHTPTPPR